jgi:polyhydroxybutyrate depolymerase
MSRRCLSWSVLAVGCGFQELPDVADPCGAWPEPGLYTIEVETPEKKRKALVEIGSTTGPRDLVVALHGGTSTANEFREVTRYSDLIDAEPLVVAYPQGRKSWLWRVWNAGDCCGNIDDEHRDADDVAFLDQLVRELAPKVCADRVLAVGFSNGGMMANRWACEGEEPDAVVVGAGPLLTGSCEGPERPFRAYHGTADPKVPLAGGTLGANTWPPASIGWELWKDRNQCSGEVAETFTFGRMTCERYDCVTPTEVCILQGWEHAWPGGRNAARLDSDATLESLRFLRSTVPEGQRVTPTAPPDETGDTGAAQ